jgi:retinoid hydroxylase
MASHLKPADQMPGSFGLPYIGESFKIMFNYGWELEQHYQRYGPVFKTRILGKKYAVLVGPEANKLILQDQADRVSAYLGYGPIMEHLFGQPMMLQDGETHRHTRRLMAPAFHGKAIANYFDKMQQVINGCIDRWPQQQPVHIRTEFRKLALQVGIQLLLGVEATGEAENIERWHNTLAQGVVAIIRADLPLTAYGRSQTARRQFRAVLQNVINERQQQGNLQESNDVLGLFLSAVDEEGDGLSIDQVIDEMVHLLSGAHASVSNALIWSLVELAANPELRATLQMELQQVTGGAPLALEHLRSLSQMGYFIKEIERVYNPVGVLLFRGVVKEVEYAGYSIPPGWGILLAQAITHNLPSLYKNPEKFDPGRFAPPYEEDKKDPYSLIGFGGGAHICIGMEFGKMEIKLVLAKLLQAYDWTIHPNYSGISPTTYPPQFEHKFKAIFKPLNNKTDHQSLDENPAGERF